MRASVFLHLSKDMDLRSKEIHGALYIYEHNGDHGIFISDLETADTLAQILRAWVQDRDIQEEVSIEEALERL